MIFFPGIPSIIYDKHPQNNSIQYTNTETGFLTEKFVLKTINTKEINEEKTHRPLFNFFKNSLSPTERKEISDFVKTNGLGPDPISEHFLERTKNIRYVKVLDGGFEILLHPLDANKDNRHYQTNIFSQI